MELYHIQEADFILPAVAQDQSVNIFGFSEIDLSTGMPSRTPPEFSVVVSRDVVGLEEDLGKYVSQQLQLLQQNLTNFHLVQRTPTIVDGLNVTVVEYTWKSENGPMYQWQAYLFCPTGVVAAPNTRIALTITGTTRQSLHSQYEAAFNNLLYSFQFHR